MTDHRIEQLTAWYQPIVDLNTGKVAGCEVLSRIVAADGSAGSAAALMDEFEREPEVQYALIRKLLESIRREIVPVFARHPDFYVSVNIPPSVVGTGRIAPMLSDLDLDPWRTRLVLELTERQALCDLGRAAIGTATIAGHRRGAGRLRHRPQRAVTDRRSRSRHPEDRSQPARPHSRKPDGSADAPRHRRPCGGTAPAHRRGGCGNLGARFLPACGRRRLRSGVLLEQGGARYRDRGAAGARIRAQPGTSAAR